MRYLTANWSFDPFVIIAPLIVIWYEAGLAWLARVSFPQDTRRRRWRSLWFYGGLALLLVAVESPIDYWGGRYLWVEMIQDLLVAFAAPAMIVAGGPWRALRYGLPGRLRADLTRELLTGTAGRRPRRLRPTLTVAAFSLIVIIWHLPDPLDLAATNRLAHVWLAHVTLLAAGLLFWPNFIGAPPARSRHSVAWQIVALMFTAEVMSLLAVAMSVLAQRSWYSAYGHFPGVTLGAYADQQLAAGILVACVDFWAAPALLVGVWRLMTDDEGLNAAIDKMIGRQPGPGPDPGPGVADP